MDLAYLRAHPEHLPTFLTHQRIRETPVSGGDICAASRLTLDDGHSVFAKTWPESAGRPVPEGFFAAEAAGLRWLRGAGAVGVPEVVVALPGLLALDWVEPGEPTPEAAERFGRELAALHRAGAPAFGAEWPGFIGALAQDNTPDPGPWSDWFARRRLMPYLRLSVDDRALGQPEIRLVEELVDRIGEPRRGRAARPDPRRPLAGQPALGRRRPGVADRPGRARRASGDRPGPAHPLRRRKPPGPDPGRLRRDLAARRRVAGAGAAAPAPPAAGAHRPVRLGVPGCGRRRRPSRAAGAGRATVDR